MKISTLTGPAGLDEFSDECATELFSEVMNEFKYPTRCSLENWPIKEIKKQNEVFLKSLRHAGNVYAIFLRSHGKNNEWVKVYVGERKSSGLRDRISQHLIDKNHQTGSMLEAVKTAVSMGKKIGVSFIKVEPESLRLYVEETIIRKHKHDLPWNTHG